MIKNKKAELGLDTVKTVILALLIIGVFAIALFLTFSAVLPAVDSSSSKTTSVANETVTLGAISYLTADSLYKPTCSVTRITNGTSTVVPATNYTITNCRIVNKTSEYTDVGSWKVTYTYVSSDPNAYYVTNNISGGTVQFFNNIPTIMTILGAVVVILAVVLILYAVGRFGREQEGGL